MKPTKTKAQQRADLQSEVDRFINKGGAVAELPKGISGLQDGKTVSHPFSPSNNQTRTPVLDQVKAIDARKKPTPPPKATRRTKKVLITDDFGDPIRWVWQESK